MCTPKTPKVSNTAAVQPKPQVLTNRYFTDMRPAGRDSLRTDAPARRVPQPAAIAPGTPPEWAGLPDTTVRTLTAIRSGLQVR